MDKTLIAMNDREEQRKLKQAEVEKQFDIKRQCTYEQVTFYLHTYHFIFYTSNSQKII